MVELQAMRSDDEKAGDLETGQSIKKVGQYSFEWDNNNEFYEGLGGQDLDRTTEPVNKVGGPKGGYAGADEDESRQPLIDHDSMQVTPVGQNAKLRGIGQLTPDEIMRRREIAITQPEWFDEEKTLFDTICCCCSRGGQDRCTVYELTRYRELKQEFLHQYDESNKEHETVLTSFWTQVFTEDERLECMAQMKGDCWRTVGFQSTNPRTDFRAGGLFALLNLYYFARHSRHAFDRIKAESDDHFFMAISSINLTSRLMSYLHMNDDRVMPSSHQRLKASRQQFKKFAFIHSLSKQTFFVLHAQSMEFLFYKWLTEKANAPNPVLPPNFEGVLDTVITMVHQVLSDGSIRSCRDLQERLEARVRLVMPSSQA